MLVIFCLRLAAGMLASLLVLTPAQVNPRFYRTHFLTAMALVAGSTVLLWDEADGVLRATLIAAAVLAFAGSFVWSLEDSPGGRTLLVLSAAAALAALLLTSRALPSDAEPSVLAADLTSAAFLGAAITAMLMGHSYLIAPSMSLAPLMRLLALLGVTAIARLLVASVGLWLWTREHSLTNLNDATVLWLPVRCLLGFVGPLALGWMAWQTARIRSTQSATGILYVVVILCFLGELTSQLLTSSTHYVF